MSWTKKLLTIAALGLFAQHALAEPSLEPDAAALANLSKLNLKKTSSNVLADDANPNLFWVLPPNSGYARMDGALTGETANMVFCNEMIDLAKYSRDLSKKKSELIREVSGLKKKALAANQEASKAKEAALKYSKDNHLDIISNIDNELAKLNDTAHELYDQREQCGDSAICANLDERIKSTSQNISKLNQNKIAAIQTAGKNAQKYNKLYNIYLGKLETANHLWDGYNSVSGFLEKMRQDFLVAFNAFGRLEGGRANITYDSGWSKNVKTLNDLNPQYTFQPVRTTNAVLMPEANAPYIDGSTTILRTSIPGATELGGSSILGSFPDAISAGVIYSLSGACPINQPAEFNHKGDLASVGIVATYDYQTSYKFDITASFNMSSILTKAQEVSKKRRLLNSSNTTTSSMKSDYDDLVNISWNDHSGAIDPLVKEKREAEIRNSIFRRLAFMALPMSNDRAATLINAGAVPPSGAGQISTTLLETCPANYYCVAGAAALTILDNIFGGGKTAANFTSVKNIDIVEHYSEAGLMKQSAGVGYSIQK
ncbi:MAG: hypothetical protein QE271_10605 [Bacteriovoracaceae bacterium]|nr:hypothetical protein [Bacteriovoracaceae bacterium]